MVVIELDLSGPKAQRVLQRMSASIRKATRKSRLAQAKTRAFVLHELACKSKGGDGK